MGPPHHSASSTRLSATSLGTRLQVLHLSHCIQWSSSCTPSPGRDMLAQMFRLAPPPVRKAFISLHYCLCKVDHTPGCRNCGAAEHTDNKSSVPQQHAMMAAYRYDRNTYLEARFRALAGPTVVQKQQNNIS
eukprot:GHRQ01024012.1.p1 GENE.GHRQ01024012.1~~GHRQ01024012.1.p1  ORF type:complete len:132 (-),score=3.64 GHRQ01024012.1:20-415(-)